MRVESSKIFKKIKNFSKLQKSPKSIPKVSKRVLNMFCSNYFEFFLPNISWRVESSKIFKNIKNFSKFQKSPKSFPKVSKRVLNMFWVNFFENFYFAKCSVEGRVFEIFQKKMKNFSKLQKSPKSYPKMSKRVLNMFWVNFFQNFFCPVFHEGRIFENFQKKLKTFQNCKKAQNRSRKCPNVF